MNHGPSLSLLWPPALRLHVLPISAVALSVLHWDAVIFRVLYSGDFMCLVYAARMIVNPMSV